MDTTSRVYPMAPSTTTVDCATVIVTLVSSAAAVISGWFTDAFAVLGNIGMMALITWLSSRGFGYLTAPLTLHFGRICLLTPLLALLSVVGDLSFSIIKRTYGIKDYGNLMPGHGGVLDRFDSVLFITPAVYFIAVHWPIAF